MALSLALAAPGSGQTGPPERPRFDVVSLKHTGRYVTGSGFQPIYYKGGRLSADTPLISLLQLAYPLKPWKVDGASSLWMELYSIRAIAPENTKPDDMRAMLRTALEERLGLICHFEDRSGSVYALVPLSGKARLTPAPPGVLPSGDRHMGIFKNRSASLADFAGFLTSMLDREVVDKTGLQGRYTFDIDWTGEIQAAMQSGETHQPNPNFSPNYAKKPLFMA
jgi:uncharacterized protein (TIGR03435 family)